MQDYREYVRSLRLEDSPSFFTNSSTEHAKIVLPELFRATQKGEDLCILSRTLSEDVTLEEEYIQELHRCITELNAKLKVILTDYKQDNWERNKIAGYLKTWKNENKADITIYTASPVRTTVGDSGEQEINFTIVGNKAYRLEIDVKNRIAICTFNNTEFAKKLTGIFNQIIQSAEIVPI